MNDMISASMEMFAIKGMHFFFCSRMICLVYVANDGRSRESNWVKWKSTCPNRLKKTKAITTNHKCICIVCGRRKYQRLIWEHGFKSCAKYAKNQNEGWPSHKLFIEICRFQAEMMKNVDSSGVISELKSIQFLKSWDATSH